MENSYGVVRRQNDVEMEYNITIKSPSYGYFEFYDTETNGENWYAEGGLWFDNKKLTDYDGVFALPAAIQSLLIEKGYDLSDI
ncbi:MAG: hypothetical protein ACPIG6_07805 [Akkermansiaceae bacterium]